MAAETVTTTIRLRKDLRDGLDELAWAAGMNRSDLVRMAISDFVRRRKP